MSILYIVIGVTHLNASMIAFIEGHSTAITDLLIGVAYVVAGVGLNTAGH